MNFNDNDTDQPLTSDQIMILTRPFTAEECSLLNKAGKLFTYADQFRVISRLNEAFSPDGWSWVTETTIIGGSVLVQGRLIAAGQSKSGCSMERLGNNPEQNVKTADTDALKRAARLFGVALDLWNGVDPIHKEVQAASREEKVGVFTRHAYEPSPQAPMQDTYEPPPQEQSGAPQQGNGDGGAEQAVLDFCQNHSGLREAFNANDSVVADVRERLGKYGTISQKQINLVYARANNPDSKRYRNSPT